MAKAAKKIPSTAKRAKKKGYSKIKVKHSVKEKQKWVMLKQRGNWAFAKAASTTASGSHTVCYYDPATGLYDDCHTVQD